MLLLETGNISTLVLRNENCSDVMKNIINILYEEKHLQAIEQFY